MNKQNENFPKISQTGINQLTNIMRKEMGLEMADSSHVSPNNEKDLIINIIMVKDMVVMDFNKPIEWFDMSGGDAIDLGRKLLKMGKKAINKK